MGISVGAPEVGSQPDSYAGVVFKFKNWIETRLNWLDKNMPGKTIPTSIDNFDITDHYRIFPNPATDWLYIESASPINGVELHNLNGATVYKKPGNAGFSLKIDISPYPSGVYFLTLTRINKSPVITKIVKQ